jgi:hypothetical protein
LFAGARGDTLRRAQGDTTITTITMLTMLTMLWTFLSMATLVVVLLLALVCLGAAVWLLREASVLWRVFVRRGDGPMPPRLYAAYRRVQRVAAYLAEEGALSRVVFVETAPGVHRGLIDVSSRGQFSFVLEHMRRHGEPRDAERIVLDLGANEGLQGSHSFNFVQLGWWAALIEANPALDAALRKNTLRKDRWQGNERRVIVRNVAATEHLDGEQPLYVQGWRHTSTSLREDLRRPEHYVVAARAESVRTLADGIDADLKAAGLASGLAKTFGLLSLDIEGVDFEVLRGFLNLGYRPQYVIVEARADLLRCDALLEAEGYARLDHFDADAIYHRAARS